MKFEKSGTLTQAVLKTIGIAGLGLIAITAPGAMRALLPLVSRKFGRDPHVNSLMRAVRKLRERRMVKFVIEDGKTKLEITEKGRKRLKELEFENMRLQLPEKWEGQWTVVIFDIPEKYKEARDALRIKLNQIGCFPYNKSVFVHPTDCSDEIDFIAEYFDVGKFVTHFRAAELGKREHLPVRFFSLRLGL